MTEMERVDTIQRVLEYAGMVLALVFVVLGLGILSGLVLTESMFFGGGVRILVGVVLTGYGIIRGIMSYRRLRSSADGGRNG
jgi:NADH:ubiquinone oxidoreductase subunit H